MSEPKQNAPPRRQLRRAISVTLLNVVFLCSVLIYTQFFSPRQRLWRELSAYQTSIQRGNPRPDLVPHLTSDSIPFLLEWIESKEIPASFSQSLARTLNKVSPSLGAKLVNLDSSPPFYPPTLALLGFDFLGSQASVALPLLHQMVIRSDTHDDATAAMIAIGPNAFPIAVELAADSHPRIRRTGAHLLGALRANAAESSAILLKLIDDPDQGVRHEAYNAVAEFPSADNESILVPRLANDDPAVFFDAAYSLHSASTNSLLHMLNIAQDSTNRPTRIAVLAALAFRDQLSKIEAANGTKRSLYQKKRSSFNVLAVGAVGWLFPNPPDKVYFELIRLNVISGGLPRVREILRLATASVASSAAHQNQ